MNASRHALAPLLAAAVLSACANNPKTESTGPRIEALGVTTIYAADPGKLADWYASRFRDIIGCGDAGFPNTVQAFQNVMHSDDRGGVLAKIRLHLENQSRLDLRCRIVTRGGSIVWCRLRGEAEGAAIRARADALRANADLVQLQAVEKWDGKLPTTMVPSTALPFINLQPPPTRNE